MSFPLYYFLYAYYVYLAFWLIFSIVALYHLMKYGFKNFFTFFIICLYVGISFGLLMFSYYSLSQFDWELNISLLNLNNSNF
jgi:hypothetical protein